MCDENEIISVQKKQKLNITNDSNKDIFNQEKTSA